MLGTESGRQAAGRLGGGQQAGPARQEQAQVLLLLQEPRHRAGQGAVRTGQPPGRVAQDFSDQRN